jgi:hypothetical protein
MAQIDKYCAFTPKNGTEELANYSPISLIHAIAKIIAKNGCYLSCLANE